MGEAYPSEKATVTLATQRGAHAAFFQMVFFPYFLLSPEGIVATLGTIPPGVLARAVHIHTVSF